MEQLNNHYIKDHGYNTMDITDPTLFNINDLVFILNFDYTHFPLNRPQDICLIYILNFKILLWFIKAHSKPVFNKIQFLSL